MSVFTYILIHNIAPVLVLILMGYGVSKKFTLDIFTLSKLNFYLFIPAFIFVNLTETELNFGMFKILWFCIAYVIANGAFAYIIAKVRGWDVGKYNAFKNSIMWNNTGNIGVSLVTLVFSGNPYIVNGETPYLSEALAVLIIIMVFTNVAGNTVGFYQAGRAHMDIRKSLKFILTMPAIYVFPLALILKNAPFDITNTLVWPALVYLKNGLVAIALLTLSVQLSKTSFKVNDIDVSISTFSRLILGPILAIFMIKIFDFTGIVAQTILIGHAVPTAVNTALIAVECENYPEFATQTVVSSTLLSTITLTFVIYFARIVFPI